MNLGTRTIIKGVNDFTRLPSFGTLMSRDPRSKIGAPAVEEDLFDLQSLEMF